MAVAELHQQLVVHLLVIAEAVVVALVRELAEAQRMEVVLAVELLHQALLLALLELLILVGAQAVVVQVTEALAAPA
jgi:hypothetical protein